MTYLLKSNINNITHLPTFTIQSVSVLQDGININNIKLDISPLHNLILDIIKNTSDKKLLIISILKFNNEVINNFREDINNMDANTQIYINNMDANTQIYNNNKNISKILYFKQITNILHLVIYNNLDIDILLYSLLVLYYIEINDKLNYNYFVNHHGANHQNISFRLCEQIINFNNYKFNIINTKHNYYNLFLQNQNSIHNTLELVKFETQITSLTDEVKIYKNIVNKLILEMEKINQQNDLLEKLKELIK